MFTPTDRDQLLDNLVAHAQADPSVTAAALVGSAARHRSDRWSDIDLALRLSPSTDPLTAANAWSRHLAGQADVAHHVDIWAGPTLYRAFLLVDSLQVDLSFSPDHEFAGNGEPFELLFGDANAEREPAETNFNVVVGWAWLYALHVRSALARRRNWQAMEMLDGLRHQLTVLLCLRSGVPAHQGRGVDQLPDAVLTSLTATLVPRPDGGPILVALRAAVALLRFELEHFDPVLAGRLQAPLETLCSSAD